MPNVLPCMRDWYERNIAGPARREAEIAKAERVARQAATAATAATADPGYGTGEDRDGD